MNFLKLWLFVLLSATPSLTQALQIEWSHVVGGTGTDYLTSVRQTSDGGYALAGGTESYSEHGGQDAWLIKLDVNGDSLWSRTYGGAANDNFASILQTADGGFILVGYTASFGTGGNLYLVRTDADGNSLWSRSYGSSNSDVGMAVVQTPDGGFAIGGSWSRTNSDFWLLKTDANGDTLWTRRYGSTFFPEECNDLTLTRDGGFLLTGSQSGSGASLWVARTGADGWLLWDQSYGSVANYEYGMAAAQAPDGGFLLAGYRRAEQYGNGDYWLVRIDSAGTSPWNRAISNGADELCYAIESTYDGGYIVAGKTGAFDWTNNDVYLVKTDSGGVVSWTQSFNGGQTERAADIRQTADSGYVVVGTSRNRGWVFKLSPDVPPAISVEPDSLPLGDRWIGNVSSDTIWISNPSSAALHVTAIQSDNPVFPTSPNDYTIAPHGTRAVPYSCTLPDTLSYRGVLTIVSDAGNPTLPISAHGIWTELRAEPAEVHLGFVAVSDTVDTVITLHNVGNTFLRIQSTAFAHGFFLLPQPPEDTVQAYGSFPVTIRYICQTVELVADTLIIECSVGGGLRIPLSAGVSAADEAPETFPDEFALDQNFPNPFNPSTCITFDLPRRTFVTLEVFDVLGRHRATLLSQTMWPGHHSMNWSCADCASGLYFIRMHAEGRTLCRKMMFLR
ncbi:MAG: hypothetical protein PHI18_10500 [bacterium]|nr:hypothetical protein [bacterium]